ncbi:zinc metallopeptidase [Jeotgalibaca ciconiae]|uniref:Zinc metallopeptidase n=1 Tax=Jeotgalibaca ciconiae TaxID=2496265 RepID=A0A3S9H9D6_9LACT|nr:zinc metallopeptidase [Jeotgalibaca ciconiae]AZP03947.1 zinc metallopeptidase [Jeotgalibaca ciconiae]
MPFMYFPIDSTYLLIILGLVISLIAQAYVKSSFSKYSKELSKKGYTATQAAQYILEKSRIYDVRVERIQGDLTDHYDPRDKVLRLSDATAQSTSVAAIGVAAHEVGHAIQDQENYIPLRARAALVPVVNFGQTISMPMILIGLFMGGADFLIQMGILLFSLTFIFQVVTLPVEFNASRRALQILDGGGILERDEVPKARKVLNAAALTYVAAAIMSFLQLLRLVMLFGGNRRRN